MRKQLVLVLVVGLLVAADDAKKEDGKKKAKGFEGTWEVVSINSNGKDNKEAKGEKVIFKGKNITVKGKKGDHKATFTLDPEKKAIDLSPTDGPNKGKIHKGIYELKKGELKICFAGPDKDRPTKFTSEEGSGNTLVVLKRAKSE
jgi:uncharacterized protein (TIGR03067 family)